MIATVRIAPVEQWKDKHPDCVGVLEPGMPVAIDTASMWLDYSEHPGQPFKSWRLVGQGLEFFQRIEPAANSICEHLLEMD